MQRDMTKSVAKRGMAAKANEIKLSYANVHKLTIHDIQVCMMEAAANFCYASVFQNIYTNTSNLRIKMFGLVVQSLLIYRPAILTVFANYGRSFTRKVTRFYNNHISAFYVRKKRLRTACG